METARTIHESTFRDYLRIIFSYKIIFLVMPIAIMLPAYFSLQLKTPAYTASVKMFVKAAKGTEADYYQGLLAGNIVFDHLELVTSNIVLARVVEALNLYEIPPDYEKKFASPFKAALIDSRLDKERLAQFQELTSREKKRQYFNSAVNKLRGNVSAEILKASSFFQISVSDFNPSLAILIANSVSRSYVMFDLEQQVQELQLKYGDKHSTVMQLKNYITEINESLDGKLLPDIEAIGPATVKIISQAEGAAPGFQVNKPMLLIMAFTASILFSVIFAFLLNYFDQTFKTLRDVETVLNLPVIGSIPKKKFKESLLIGDANPLDTPYSKALHTVADKMFLLMKENNFKTLLIADAEASHDTAALIANIAISMAGRSSCKVLIIDANFRTPSVSEVLTTNNNSGLADILEGKISFLASIKHLGSNLHVLTVGKSLSSAPTLLDSPMMKDLIKELEGIYDAVFISCADIKNYTDARILSSFVDSTAFVINEGKVRQQVLKNALSAFHYKKYNVMGVILNRREYAIPELIYKVT